MLLHELHFLVTRLPNQDWIQPSSFGIVPVLPSRIEFRSCTICPPSLLRLRLFSIFLERGGGQVEGPDLCSARHVHHGRCVAYVANFLPKTFSDLGIQILSTFGSFHPPGNMWAVREEALSFSTTPVSCVTKRVEDVMPALQAYHARERELRCVATEIVQEPGSSPVMVQDCQEQYALAISDGKLRALLADQPQNFALIFSITEVPTFAFMRVGSKVKDVTLHIRRGVVLCWWLCLFAQHSPRLSESCASCPLLKQILRHLFVSTSVNDPPFSSISAANYGLRSLRNVTQLGSALRVVGRKQSSSTTTVDSHPFFLGLHPFITFLVIEGVDPDPLLFLFLPQPTLWVSSMSLSGSPTSASTPCSLGDWSTFTLDSAGRGCGLGIATGFPVTSCSFPAPSRELDAPLPSLTSRSGL